MDSIIKESRSEIINPFTLGTYRYFGSFDNIDLCREAVDACFASGIYSFDTARSYGNGLAENILGICLGDYDRESISISTKVFDSAAPGIKKGLNYQNIKTSTLISLDQLNTDYIDVLYLHRYDPTVDVFEICDALIGLLDSGYIRRIGVSMWPCESTLLLSYVLKIKGYTNAIYIQYLANAISSHDANTMKLLKNSSDFIFYAYSPFARGLLRGSKDEFISKINNGYWCGTELEQFSNANIDCIKMLHDNSKKCIEHTALDWCFKNGFQGVVFGISDSQSIFSTLKVIKYYVNN